MNSRRLHDDERVVFEGPVKIEDRAAAYRAEIKLKDRYAVMSQTRLLLFKNERENNSDALAVYPIT